MLNCSLDGGRTTWKPVTEQKLADACEASRARPRVVEAPPRSRHRHGLRRPVRINADRSAKCFAFNGKQYCEWSRLDCDFSSAEAGTQYLPHKQMLMSQPLDSRFHGNERSQIALRPHLLALEQHVGDYEQHDHRRQQRGEQWRSRGAARVNWQALNLSD